MGTDSLKMVVTARLSFENDFSGKTGKRIYVYQKGIISKNKKTTLP